MADPRSAENQNQNQEAPKHPLINSLWPEGGTAVPKSCTQTSQTFKQWTSLGATVLLAPRAFPLRQEPPSFAFLGAKLILLHAPWSDQCLPLPGPAELSS